MPLWINRIGEYREYTPIHDIPYIHSFPYILGKEVGRLDSPYPSPTPYLSPQRTGGSKKFEILKILNSLRSDSKIFLTNLKFFDLILNYRIGTFSGKILDAL